jgi:doubled CXXCH motif protein
MRAQAPIAQNCLDCHAIRTAHLEAPDSACATCHLPLVQAVRLTRARVGDFPTPQSHRDPAFATTGHGKLAQPKGVPIAASCTTCHARDYCTECHVNAPEVPAIQALGPDPRSLALKAELEAPPDHADPRFLGRHGGQARKEAAKCAVCHTQESCVACHIGSPASVQSVHAAGPGRGPGATIRRERPTSHGLDFSELHAQPASARPQSCSACHTRPTCLSCHRPDAAAATPGYHPAGFLTSHPAAAYSRESSCSDCHNQGQFCANCHLNAGLVSPGQLRDRGYHDAKQSFLLNHGQAARQNLESCVSCHSERDCLTCHSAVGGRRFNPHGPGFDPGTLRRKNPSMCTACHGAAIPER